MDVEVKNNRHNKKRTSDAISPNDTVIPKIPKTAELERVKNLVFIKGVSSDLMVINPVKIKEAILDIDSTVTIKQIRYTKDSLKVQCKNEIQKEKFMSIRYLLGIEVISSKHNSLNRGSINYDDLRRVIIFGVGIVLTENEICKETTAISAKRLNKKDSSSNSRVPTESVILEFTSDPPPYVNIGYKRHKTKTYIPLPTCCFNCQRYGHSKNACKGRTTCPRCSKGHKFEDCPLSKFNSNLLVNSNQSELGVRCANCKMTHSAAFRGCPVFTRNKEILEIKTLNNISFGQSSKQYKENALVSAQETVAVPSSATLEAHSSFNPQTFIDSTITESNQPTGNTLTGNFLRPTFSVRHRPPAKTVSINLNDHIPPPLDSSCHYPPINSNSLTSTPTRVDQPRPNEVKKIDHSTRHSLLKSLPKLANFSHSSDDDPEPTELLLEKFCHFFLEMLSSFFPIDLITAKLTKLMESIVTSNQELTEKQNFIL